MFKNVLKVGVGVAIGYGLATSKGKIEDFIFNLNYKKFYGNSNEEDVESAIKDYESAPDVIHVESAYDEEKASDNIVNLESKKNEDSQNAGE